MGLVIMRRIRFCAGHRLLGHEGKCQHFHGHNYVADFYVTGTEQDNVGRVIDFAVLKARCKGWLDENWDHSFIIWDQDTNALRALQSVTPTRYFLLPYNPTSENLARYLLDDVCPKILEGTSATAVRVRIWESEESFAEASIPGTD